MNCKIPQFGSRKELFNFLRENKELLMMQKTSAIKHGDSFYYNPPAGDASDHATKEVGIIQSADINMLNVKAAINTTNFLDGHGDVHIPGLWKKNLKEQTGNRYALECHQQKFENVMASGSDVRAYTKTMTWKSLGYEFEGSTEVLIYDFDLKANRNAKMFEQYKNGWVYNHSVGMYYVKAFFCVNSEEKWWRDEKENFDKYYPQIVNQEVADENGFFWAVTEAKTVEGSAVLFGSNSATPTLSVTEQNEQTEDIAEAGKSTSDNHNEPPVGTRSTEIKNFSNTKFF